MSSLIVFYSPIFLRHDTKKDPESAARLLITQKALQQSSFAKKICWKEPAALGNTEEQKLIKYIVQLGVHCPKYLKNLQPLCEKGGKIDDTDTVVGDKSFSVALLAAKTWMDAVDTVCAKEGKCTAFVLARPPGHHAQYNSSRGMCLLSNAAIAAMHAIQTKKATRVAILDYDVHHGDGTQAAVMDKSGISFCSIHQAYFWRGSQKKISGTAQETGKTKNVLNVPLEPNSGIAEYLDAFETKVMPFFAKIKPDLLIVSAGYDAQKLDPLAHINLEPEHYKIFSSKYIKKLCNKVVFGLEGGYHLESLASAVVNSLEPFS